MTSEEIIKKLPYQDPFLFVDELHHVSENLVEGTYTLKENEYFYQGHFKENPITPGVILTEIMAQIGLVCLGIYLLRESIIDEEAGVAMSSTEIQFYKSVLPGETLTVISEKEYFRFNKLKCNVTLFNAHKVKVAQGIISGMIVPLPS